MFTASKNEQVNCKSVASDSSWTITETTATGVRLVTTVTLKKSVQKYSLPTRGRQMIAKASFASCSLQKRTKPVFTKLNGCRVSEERPMKDWHNDYYMFLLFSTEIVNLKTVGECTAARELTRSLSTHKTGKTKTKKHKFFLVTQVYIFIFIMYQIQTRNILISKTVIQNTFRFLIQCS